MSDEISRLSSTLWDSYALFPFEPSPSLLEVCVRVEGLLGVPLAPAPRRGARQLTCLVARGDRLEVRAYHATAKRLMRLPDAPWPALPPAWSERLSRGEMLLAVFGDDDASDDATIADFALQPGLERLELADVLRAALLLRPWERLELILSSSV